MYKRLLLSAVIFFMLSSYGYSNWNSDIRSKRTYSSFKKMLNRFGQEFSVKGASVYLA